MVILAIQHLLLQQYCSKLLKINRVRAVIRVSGLVSDWVSDYRRSSTNSIFNTLPSPTVLNILSFHAPSMTGTCHPISRVPYTTKDANFKHPTSSEKQNKSNDRRLTNKNVHSQSLLVWFLMENQRSTTKKESLFDRSYQTRFKHGKLSLLSIQFLE